MICRQIGQRPVCCRRNVARNAEDLCARHVCLPVFSGMEDRDAEQVLQALRDVVG